MVRAVHPVVAVHGFAGTGAMWDPVAERLPDGVVFHAPDLPGHGTASSEAVGFDTCVAAVLREAPERFVLAGYSMGGRIALHVALAAPERVAQLLLISTTAGIEHDAERAERRCSDEALAADIERGSIEDFAERWSALPLFAGDPPEAVSRWRADMLRNSPAGLAASLRGVGTGAMEPLWGRLSELRISATVMAGERDSKFCVLAERLASMLPNSGPVIVATGSGHGVPRESPGAVAACITKTMH